jgi:hypothetical protein
MTLHNDKIMFSYPHNSFIKCFSAGKKWVHKQYTVGILRLTYCHKHHKRCQAFPFFAWFEDAGH